MMRTPISSHTAHQQSIWLQIGMTVVGGIALGLLILQVLAGRDHGFIGRQDALFQPPPALHQPAKR
jgi:hypothetical protein